MISVLIGTSLVKTAYDESIRGRSVNVSLKAFYIANSGYEEAMYRIQQPGSFGYPVSESFTIPIFGGSVDVTVSGTEDQRIIESAAIYENYIRKVKVVVQNTSLKPGFASAIHAGLGGVELRNQTLITSKDGSGGNIYSNSYIKSSCILEVK